MINMMTILNGDFPVRYVTNNKFLVETHGRVNISQMIPSGRGPRVLSCGIAPSNYSYIMLYHSRYIPYKPYLTNSPVN